MEAPPKLPRKARARTAIEPLLNAFTILVDSAEQQPFTFHGLHADNNRGNRLLRFEWGVNLQWHCLGRHPHSLGDYSIGGFVGRCHIERKGLEDAHGTILGWPDLERPDLPGRRERFEQELANLSNIEAGCVVVECSLERLLDEAPEYRFGHKDAACNRKILHRSIIAWQQDYPGCPWFFCDTRQLAEETAFRFLERFYNKHKQELKQ